MNKNIEFKKVKVSDLFFPQTTKYTKLQQSKKKCPEISNKSTDNGVKEYVYYKPTEKGNVITYSDTRDIKAMFYQPIDFIGGSHVKKLVPKDEFKRTNKYTLLYVISCIKKTIINDYDWQRKLNDENIQNVEILLPFNIGTNQIDYDYMENFIKEIEEQYIKEIEEQYIKELDTYLNVLGYNCIGDCKLTKEDKDLLNYEPKTKEFKLNELFDIYHGKRHIRKNRKPGNIPLITAKKENNGIAEYISNPLIKFNENTITINMFGKCFYQTQEYAADDNIYVLENQQLNRHTMLYITTILQKYIANKYSFVKQFRYEGLYDIRIHLPYNFDYDEIDYNYIENYMRIIEKIKVIKLSEQINEELMLLDKVKNNY